jgi:molybdate transport system ATP-binding protein
VVHGKTSQVLVHPGLSDTADYATLENLLESEVVSDQDDDGLSELKIGDAHLVAPDVLRRQGDSVMVSIRAGDIILALEVPPMTSARNVIGAVIEGIHVIGPRVLVYADVGARLVVEITQSSLRELDLREGQNVHLIIKTNSIMVLDAPRGQRAAGG